MKWIKVGQQFEVHKCKILSSTVPPRYGNYLGYGGYIASINIDNKYWNAMLWKVSQKEITLNPSKYA